MINLHTVRVGIAGCTLAVAACSSGSTPGFSVSNASVDSSYSCPVAASNAHYDMHGTIDAHNPSSKEVNISSVAAVMTLSAVKGGWLQKVGDRYDAGTITFTPTSVGAGANATLAVTVPSACTGRAANDPVASGDYAVSFTITTSAGTFKVDSKDKHRIITA